MEIGENCYTTDPKISHSLIFIMNVNFQYIVSPSIPVIRAYTCICLSVHWSGLMHLWYELSVPWPVYVLLGHINTLLRILAIAVLV